MPHEWRRYRLAWRLASPLHIGYRTIGTIARTRLWVPGRNVWGALIDTLARAQGATPLHAELFRTLQSEVQQGLRFESWFVTPQNADTPPRKPWYPQQKQDGWYYDLATEQQMQRMVLGSAVGTAIEHGPGIAQEGMIFETEYIAPRTLHPLGDVPRNTPLWLVGYLWIASDAYLTWQQQHVSAQAVIEQHAKELSIGGEQAKGYGQMVGGTCTPCETSPYQIDAEGRMHILAKEPFPLLVQATQNQGIRGRVEPIVGRTTEAAQRHGARLESAQFCWLPGAVSDVDRTVQVSAAFPGIATIT